MKSTSERFAVFASRIAWAAGRPATFFAALGLIVAWSLAGPFVAFSDTWQLAINTTTTIVTFLMVFLIQNTQHRDGMAVQLKLDELMRATKEAHNELLDLEELDADELLRIKARYEALARAAREVRSPDGG